MLLPYRTEYQCSTLTLQPSGLSNTVVGSYTSTLDLSPRRLFVSLRMLSKRTWPGGQQSSPTWKPSTTTTVRAPRSSSLHRSPSSLRPPSGERTWDSLPMNPPPSSPLCLPLVPSASRAVGSARTPAISSREMSAAVSPTTPLTRQTTPLRTSHSRNPESLLVRTVRPVL